MRAASRGWNGLACCAGDAGDRTSEILKTDPPRPQAGADVLAALLDERRSGR